MLSQYYTFPDLKLNQNQIKNDNLFSCHLMAQKSVTRLLIVALNLQTVAKPSLSKIEMSE